MQDTKDKLQFCNADGSPVGQNISIYDLQYRLAIGSVLPVENWLVTASIEWENELAYMEKIDPCAVVMVGKEFEDSWG